MHLTSIKLTEATQSLLDSSDRVQLRFEEETMTREKANTFLVEAQLTEAQNFISNIKEKHTKVFTYLNPQLTETLTLNELLVYRQIMPIPNEANSNEDTFEKFRTKPSFVMVQQDTTLVNKEVPDNQSVLDKVDKINEDEPHSQNELNEANTTIDEQKNELDNVEEIKADTSEEPKYFEYDSDGTVNEDMETMIEANPYDVSTINEAYTNYIEDITAEIEFDEIINQAGIQSFDDKVKNILHVAFDYGRLMNERDEPVSLKQAYLKTTSLDNITELIEDVHTILNEEGFSNASFIFEEYVEDVKQYDGMIFERYIEQVSENI